MLLVPMQSMLKPATAEKWRDQHTAVARARARETGMWLVTADVTGRRGDLRIAYGPTCVVDPGAGIVARVPLLTTGMVTAEIVRSQGPVPA